MTQNRSRPNSSAFAPARSNLRLASLLLFLVLGGCQPRPIDWQQDVYIWQRNWSESIAQSIGGLSREIGRHRVLVAQWGAGQPDFHLDLAGVMATLSGRDMVPVLRLDGTRLPVSPQQALDSAVEIVAVLRRAGVRVSALEIDHDTATAAVGDYADWLAELRRRLPVDLDLWITALPDWRHSPDIERLLGAVDVYTLQVHAVDASHDGLMDQAVARDWVRAFSMRFETPFFVALPTYQLRAGLESDGSLRFLEAEAAVPARAANERWLFMPPQALGRWISELRQESLPNLRGLAWFRLPSERDRANLGIETLNALIEGQEVVVEMDLIARPVREGGRTYDLAWINHGPHDGAWPHEATLPAGCGAGQGANGFEMDARSGRLAHDQPGLLRVGEQIGAGWVRCTEGWEALDEQED
ncbi:hypothetical protein WM2015_1083 [Wenzhouxiangella marina]|uniref:DUF3142 domain-containing protein n=1 Tax=Wenzhouxiangella marina TaxID=1579979 RepID=A0A0K0XUU9_9GAMM|nr:hypothetical protein WM2015_1083 [Wenzhouxiangella marina]